MSSKTKYEMAYLHRKMKEQLKQDSADMAKVMQETHDKREEVRTNFVSSGPKTRKQLSIKLYFSLTSSSSKESMLHLVEQKNWPSVREICAIHKFDL
jgi:outer membrane receptor for ferrienterochelin and colicin